MRYYCFHSLMQRVVGENTFLAQPNLHCSLFSSTYSPNSYSCIKPLIYVTQRGIFYLENILVF